MASTTSSTVSSNPLDIIFSCTYCGDTVSEVYKDAEAPPLADGSNSVDQLSTKLWVTGCGHVICSRHFGGGGPPFHQAGERPEAPCPVCSEKGDYMPKELLGMRGFREDDCDPGLPERLFRVPPVKFEGGGSETEALQFHYQALLNFGKLTQKKRQEIRNLVHTLEDKIQTSAATCKALERQNEALESHVKTLKEHEAEWRKWKKREPVVKHYLGVVKEMADENSSLKKQLLRLGYEVPQTNYALKLARGRELAEHGDDSSSKGTNNARVDPISGGTGSSRTLSGKGKEPAHASTERDSNSHTESTHKRPYSEYVEDEDIKQPGPSHRRSSRDLMPPPPLPSRQPEPRIDLELDDVPTVVRETSSRRHDVNRDTSPPREMQFYRNGNWREYAESTLSESQRSQDQRHNSESQVRDAHKGHALPSRSVGQGPSKSSAVPSHNGRGVNAPFKPLFPRLSSEAPMDKYDESSYVSQATVRPSQSRIPSEDTYFRQEPHFRENVMPDRFDNQRDYPRLTNPVYQDALRLYEEDELLRERAARLGVPGPSITEVLLSRARQHDMGPKTPARYDRPRVAAPSVTSPFFRREPSMQPAFDRRDLYIGTRERPETTSRTQQSYRIAPAQSKWREPKNLNGLSFITDPRNSRNEPIYADGSGYGGSGSSYMPERLTIPSTPRIRDEAGLFQRPDSRYQDPAHRSYIRGDGPLISGRDQRFPSQRSANIRPNIYPPQSAGNYQPDDSIRAFRGARSGSKGPPVGSFSSNVPMSRGLFSSAGGRRSVRR